MNEQPYPTRRGMLATAAASVASISGLAEGGHGTSMASDGRERDASPRAIQNKLREIGISPMDFGAVGDGRADDSAAVQAAVDACLASASPKPLRVDGQFRLRRTIMIDRPVDQSATRFIIAGEGLGRGFQVADDIDMFGTRLSVGNDPRSEGIYFRDIVFSSDDSKRKAQCFVGGGFLRMTFDNCEWYRLRCLNSPIYVQSWHFRDCRAFDWTGAFFSAEGAYDLTAQMQTKFGDTVFRLVSKNRPVMRARFHDGVYEGNRGPLLQCANAAGLMIDGNYIEYNGAPALDFAAGPNSNAAISVSGNIFVQTDDAKRNPDFFDIRWGRTRRGVSTGNFCNGKLHDSVDLIRPGDLLTIMGDVADIELYRGFVTDPQKRRPVGNVQLTTDSEARLAASGRHVALDLASGGLSVALNSGSDIVRLVFGEHDPQTGNDHYGDPSWGAGSRVINAAPARGQPKGWICLTGGRPGVWVSEGPL